MSSILNILENLDNIDKKIIELLAQNSRISYVDIGKVINLSRVAVKSRIQILEQKGIISKYSIIINPEKIGKTISASFDIEVLPNCFQEVSNTLNENPNIIKLYHITGKSKLHMHAVFESDSHLELFLCNILYKLPGLISIDCNAILARIKDNSEIML